MGHNHHRQVQLHDQAAQQIEQARLHRYVQPAGGLIHKHQPRLRHQIAGDLQALLHPAGKGGGQVVNARRRDLHLLQPLPGGGANIAVVTGPGGHQAFADIAAGRDLAAQAVHRMLMHHAPFGAQQTSAIRFAHGV